MNTPIDKLGKVSITVEKHCWNILKDYDRLVIVERAGTKTTYLSRKPVPAGIDITDREYWIPFSKWNEVNYEVVQEFGNSTEVVVSQKVLTEKLEKIDEHFVRIDENFEKLQNAINELPNTCNQELRISKDGQSIEISSDGGETWLPFIPNFNKIRVIGYVESKEELPKVAELGDIYGVWNETTNNGNGGTGAYELYINTVKDWGLENVISKIYSYDTELPSSAKNNTFALVPVTDLTLDKNKVDGYKVYKYNIYTDGWTMILNTAEIYSDKESIVNHGDNIYALVIGDSENTYNLYKRQVEWVYFGNNASITYKLIQNINEGTENNIPSCKAIKDAIEDTNNKIKLVALGTNVTLSISPSIIYKNEAINITLNGIMNKVIPSEMKLLDGSSTLKSSNSSPITHTIQGLTLTTNNKEYTINGIVNGITFDNFATIQARYPIYYGFGVTASSIATEDNKYPATTSAANTYTKTNSSDGKRFYILVPNDIDALTSFTMGGTPFVMNSSIESINGIQYKVYSSANTYNANIEISIVAS